MNVYAQGATMTLIPYPQIRQCLNRLFVEQAQKAVRERVHLHQAYTALFTAYDNLAQATDDFLANQTPETLHALKRARGRTKPSDFLANPTNPQG